MSETKGTLEGIQGLSSDDFVNLLSKSSSTSANSETKPSSTESTPSTAVSTTEIKDQTPSTSVVTPDDKGKKPDLVDPEKKIDPNLDSEKKSPESTVDPNKQTEAKKPENEFELSLEENSQDTPENDDVMGWKETAKLHGFEIETDSQEEYLAGVDKFYKEKYEPNLGKFNPEAQRFFQFLEAGGTLDQFIQPLQPINELRSLSPEDLIAKDLELRKWAPELITKEIARLTSANEIDLQHKKLLEQLDQVEENVKQKIIADQLSAQSRSDLYKQNTDTTKIADIKKSLSGITEFLETKLPDKAKDVITKNWESGKYAKLMNDPKVMAEFSLFCEFKDQAVKLLKEREQIRYKSDRHNIPPAITAEASSATTASHTGKEASGNWAALEGFNEVVFSKK